MKKNLSDITKFLSTSNLWIALASFCFYQVSLVQLDIGLKLNATSLFIFFSALFTYNLLQYVGQNNKKKRFSFFTKIILVLSALGILISLYYISYSTISLLILAGLLTFYYATPFFQIGRQGFSLRNFWFLKSITVALVWTITCSIIPLLEFNATETQLYLFSLEKFLFILGITIPYDIKDLQKDQSQKGMTSFAMKFGVSKTILVANIILFTSFCLAFYLFPIFRLASVIIYSLAILLNFFTNEKRSSYWFTFLIDGLIIFYALLYFLFYKF